MAESKLGSGMAEKARLTIKQHRCVQDRMALDGLTEAEARAACGANVKQPPEGMPRVGKKKGGLVSKSANKKSSSIHSASKNHKFSY